MDFQKLADSFLSPTCIISVEKISGGGYGEIRIVAGNEAYLAPIEHPAFAVSPDIPANTHNKFIPNSLYEKYLPKDLGFEDLCYRSAVMKTPVHTYVHLNKLDMWFDIFAMPINCEIGNICYCTYTTKLSSPSDIGISSGMSGGTSEDVLKTCIKLHGAKDFKKTIDEVITDIRMLCRAEVCTIMLIDNAEATCSVLATNVAENSRLKRVTQFSDFYDIAFSWLSMIGESDCLIIKNDNDMNFVKEVNRRWYDTLVEANVKSVVMFPLRYTDEVIGFIWATNFDTNNTMRIKEMLELTTFFISSQITSYKMMERLEHISYTDLLTGVKNRNAMNSRLNSIAEGKEYLSSPLGMIFTDMNGLKYVNDTHGHAAGDLMLKKFAILLQETVPDGDIYRTGGDEFLILVKCADSEELASKVAALVERSYDPEGICFAVGSSFIAQGSDIHDAMHTADEAMYRNKARFYAEHPERKTRL